MYTGGGLWFNAAASPMTRALERLLRLQRGDLPRGLLLFAHLFLVICAYLVGQVARDALFLGRFSASLLPFADMSLFLCVAVVVGLYVRAGRRLSLDRLISGSLLVFGTISLVLALARPSARRRRGSTPPSTSGSACWACWRPRRSGRSPTTCSRRARRGALRLRRRRRDRRRHGRRLRLERARPPLRRRRACSVVMALLPARGDADRERALAHAARRAAPRAAGRSRPRAWGCAPACGW